MKYAVLAKKFRLEKHPGATYFHVYIYIVLTDYKMSGKFAPPPGPGPLGM